RRTRPRARARRRGRLRGARARRTHEASPPDTPRRSRRPRYTHRTRWFSRPGAARSPRAETDTPARLRAWRTAPAWLAPPDSGRARIGRGAQKRTATPRTEWDDA